MKLQNFIIGALTILIISQTGNVMAQKDSEHEFEMKKYYFVFLNSVTGAKELDSSKMAEIQAGHLANIGKMFDEGKCKLAGPFMDKDPMRGILILNVATEEEARKLMDNDPAVINGYLDPVIRPWYGPAGLKVFPKGD